jgi:MFS transporter, ACS family, pantothenate transporter
MFWAWTQDTLAGEPAARAFASAGLNAWASISHAVMPLVLFQTVHRPAVVAGNYGAAGFAILRSATAIGLANYQHRRGKQSADDESNMKKGCTENGSRRVGSRTDIL